MKTQWTVTIVVATVIMVGGVVASVVTEKGDLLLLGVILLAFLGAVVVAIAGRGSRSAVDGSSQVAPNPDAGGAQSSQSGPRRA